MIEMSKRENRKAYWTMAGLGIAAGFFMAITASMKSIFFWIGILTEFGATFAAYLLFLHGRE